MMDAVGPESFEYRELVTMLGRAIGCQRALIAVPRWAGYAVGQVVGLWHRDVFVTREEIAGLMAGLLDTEGPPTGTTLLSAWAREHSTSLGRTYANELRRRRQRSVAYVELADRDPPAGVTPPPTAIGG